MEIWKEYKLEFEGDTLEISNRLRVRKNGNIVGFDPEKQTTYPYKRDTFERKLPIRELAYELHKGVKLRSDEKLTRIDTNLPWHINNMYIKTVVRFDAKASKNVNIIGKKVREIDETFYPLKGYEERYEINQAGQVRSLAKTYTQARSNTPRTVNPKILAVNYARVPEDIKKNNRLVLSNEEGKKDARYLQNLLYINFKGPIPEGHVVQFADRNCNNLLLSNLVLVQTKIVTNPIESEEVLYQLLEKRLDSAKRVGIGIQVHKVTAKNKNTVNVIFRPENEIYYNGVADLANVLMERSDVVYVGTKITEKENLGTYTTFRREDYPDTERWIRSIASFLYSLQV